MNSRYAWLCMSVGTSLVLALGPAARAQSSCDGVDIVVTGPDAVCTEGGAQYTADGGKPPYHFSLNDPGNTGSTISSGGFLHAGPNPGVVAVIAEDKCQCMGSKDVAIVGVVITDPVGYWESCKDDSRLFVANGIPGGGEYNWGSEWTSDPTTNIVFDAPSGPTNKIVCVTYRLGEATCPQVCTTGTVFSLEMGPKDFGACVGVAFPFVAYGMPTGMSAYAWSPAGVTNTSPDSSVSTNWVTFNSYGYDQLVECTYGPCTKTVTGLVAQVTIDPTGFWGACLSNVLVATGQPDPDGGNYSWSDGTSGRTNTVTNVGTNILSVTYNLGPASCSDVTTGIIAKVTIDPPSPWQSCGATNLVATGLPDPDGGSYLWSNGVTGRTNTVSSVGTNILSVTYTLGPATCQTLTTGIVFSVTLSPMSTNTCVGETNTFVATGLPVGAASYVWTLPPGASGTPNPQQTNKVVFSTAGLNQLVKVDYGPCSVTATANVFEVQSLVWERINSALTPNTHPSGTVGQRVFPDKDDPTDTVEHRTVKVKATIDPVKDGITIFFKVFDVDDPSTNTAPVDANDATVLKGDDNRPDETSTPNGGQLDQRMATTDAAGKAEVTLTVSRQPGNNFRVAADCHTNDLALLTVTNGIPNTLYIPGSDAQVTGFHGRITDLLTVWRRLHVELDSMTNVAGNVVTDRILEIAGTSVTATSLVIGVNLSAGLSPTDGSPNLTTGVGSGRFEHGIITNGILPDATVTTNVDGNGDMFVQKLAGIQLPFKITKSPHPDVGGNVVGYVGNTYELNVTSGGLGQNQRYKGGKLIVVGVTNTIAVVDSPIRVTIVNTLASPSALIPFVLHDDDIDTGLPRDPLAGFMADSVDPTMNLYAAAYIQPAYDGGGNATNNTHTVPFVANTESPSVYRWDSRLNNADDFWVVYVLSAWQDSFRELKCDRDANNEGLVANCPDGTQGSTDPGIGGSLIYLETIRDVGPLASGGVQEFEKRIVAHEVGHSLRLDHGDGTDNAAANGIMNTLLTNGPLGADLRFVPRHIDHLRKLQRPKN